jgi:hypothetical protein
LWLILPIALSEMNQCFSNLALSVNGALYNALFFGLAALLAGPQGHHKLQITRNNVNAGGGARRERSECTESGAAAVADGEAPRDVPCEGRRYQH